MTQDEQRLADLKAKLKVSEGKGGLAARVSALKAEIEKLGGSNGS
jgi:hypothetical protein